MRHLPHDVRDVFIDELCFIDKTRRADVVHANGKLSAFEIKSSADNLARWEGQQEAYLKCFDEVWLCCHSKHLQKSFDLTDRNVGLIVVDDYASVAAIRHPRQNKKVDPFHLTGFLWREDIDSLAKEYGVEIRKSALIKEARQIVSDALNIDIIKSYVLAVLKERYR
ncbi:sce7726 family protein [Pseudomonas aeruginosa]|uniref:sce7726 family protein n=1 Tax=Pseudomonas aeruginosa TaxID=287 RepID=UPI001920D224|nr:sce7726 family protein [Pseudomonas aeruginosa]QQV97149.1 MmcB family DNA repair protein [Pseudomonas aeruginosa]HBN8295317.1 MmcB family DNA repair protein [Pseudomonas aeruginosa]HCF5963814.1 MmcB family DNA repair protein [Pseudomonas aeruginosa]